MMGFGSYGNGGSLSSTSNLSPLAPPFTVDRSLSKPMSSPLVDLTEPPYAVPFNSSPYNWLNSHSPNSTPNFVSEFDSSPSLNAYRYSGSYTFSSPIDHVPPSNPIGTAASNAFLYDQISSGMTDVLVEAKPYYHSYTSTTVSKDGQHGYDMPSTSLVVPLDGSFHEEYTRSFPNVENTKSWDGLWNGFEDWEQHKRVDHSGNFCTNEINMAGSSIHKDFMNQAKGWRTYEEAPNRIDLLNGGKHIGSASDEHLDYEKFKQQIPIFMPVDYLKTSIVGSTSVISETWPPSASPSPVIFSGPRMTFNLSNENCVLTHDTVPNGNMSVMKSFPSLVTGPVVVDTGYSAPNIVSLENVNANTKADAMELVGDNPQNGKEPCSLLNSKGKACFNAGQLSFHLDPGRSIFADSSSTKREELSSNKSVPRDASDHFLGDKFEFQELDIVAGGVSLATDVNEALNPVENSSETIDQFNPAVDSPCWKGALVSHISSLTTSEGVTSQLVRKLEACNSPNLRGAQNFPVNPKDLSEDSMFHIKDSPENGLASSLKMPSSANYLFSDHRPVGPIEVNSCPAEQTCGCGTDGISGPGKEYTPSNLTINNFNLKPSYSIEESQLVSEKKCESGTVLSGFGFNIDDASYGSSAFTSVHAAEQVLRSPPAKDASAELTKSGSGDSAKEIYVHRLVNTMHNLSELLIFHCSRDAYELKQQNCDVLEKVITNLSKCILKNGEEITPVQGLLTIQQNTIQIPGEPPASDKDVSLGRPPVTNVAAVEAVGQKQMLFEKRDFIVPSKKDGICSDFVFPNGDADRKNNDRMTQAIRKVLSENFNREEDSEEPILLYKNLWLEAEAELCSVNYVARFNRLKVDMEKGKLHKPKELSEITTDVKKISKSLSSPDACVVTRFEAEAKSGPTPDIMSSTSHADDVMARFRSLNCREESVEKSNYMKATDVGNVSSPNASPDVKRAEESTVKRKGGPVTVTSMKDFPVVSTNSHVDDVMARFHILKCRGESNDVKPADMGKVSEPDGSPDMKRVEESAPKTKGILDTDDVEASVMARFLILKSRAENASCLDEGEQQVRALDGGFIGDWSTINDRLEDGSLDVNGQGDVAQYGGKDKLTVKEFPRPDRFGSQPLGGWFDSSSSDWEHVLREELVESPPGVGTSFD